MTNAQLPTESLPVPGYHSLNLITPYIVIKIIILFTSNMIVFSSHIDPLKTNYILKIFTVNSFSLKVLMACTSNRRKHLYVIINLIITYYKLLSILFTYHINSNWIFIIYYSVCAILSKMSALFFFIS